MNDFENRIWYNLIGFFPEIKKKIKSPFRSDNNPGCTFSQKGDYIRFFDGADSLRSGKSAIQMYMIQNNLSFEQALKECKEKFSNKKDNVFNGKKPPLKQICDNTKITPVTMSFTKEGKDYWSNLGVTDLSNIKQVKRLVFEKENSVTEKDVSKTLCFAYLFDKEQYKFYSPFAEKRYKFLGNVKGYDCWWYNEGKYDTLLTLKSSKCFKCVQSICVKYNIKIVLNHLQCECSPNYKDYEGNVTSKSLSAGRKQIPNYTKIKTYKRHLVVFDNDEQGSKAGESFKVLVDSEVYFTPFEKDIADMYLKHGEEAVKDWLLSIVTE